jgi:hypothetical protein
MSVWLCALAASGALAVATIGLVSFLWAHDNVLAKVFIGASFASFAFFYWFLVNLGNANKAKPPTA